MIPPPKKNRLKSYHINKNHQTSTKINATNFDHLSKAFSYCMHPSKTLPSSKVTNFAKRSPAHEMFSNHHFFDGNKSFSEAMNSESSRSHLVLIIKIISVNKCSNSVCGQILVGKLANVSFFNETCWD